MRKEELNRYIMEQSLKTKKDYRPSYHLAPPTGWINDPNGFIFYKGQLHVFCQFHPYDPTWGPMHWGHWVSADFREWTWLPVALVPEDAYDHAGCFSGTALEVEGQLMLMYTGVHQLSDGRTIQEQCIAQSDDGIHFTKWDSNPVLGAKDLPPDGFAEDFRDPKLMVDEQGYRVMVANRGQNKGRVLSYRSSDLKQWQYEGIFLENLSDMPECPDYFELDGKACLIVCLMNYPMEGYRFQNDHHAVVYLSGEEKDGKMKTEIMESIDLGPDFYAPQTTLLPDGRRVMIGWMQMWGEDSPTHYLGHGWAGQFTLLRELSLRDGYLYQKPVAELQALRGEAFHMKNEAVNGYLAPKGIEARRFELLAELTIPPHETAEIRLMGTGYEYFSIRYHSDTQVLSTDRSKCGYTMASNNQPEAKPSGHAKLKGNANKLQLHIFVDTSSVEVFVNDGACVLSTLAFPKGTAEEISFVGCFTIEKLTRWMLP